MTPLLVQMIILIPRKEPKWLPPDTFSWLKIRYKVYVLLRPGLCLESHWRNSQRQYSCQYSTYNALRVLGVIADAAQNRLLALL